MQAMLDVSQFFPPDFDCCLELRVATASELTTQFAALGERVTNHIRFFWVVVGFGFLWLGSITALLVHTNGTVNQVQQAQANAPAQIVAKLLNRPADTEVEMAATLSAVSTILSSSKVGRIVPDYHLLDDVSAKISNSQSLYPTLPQVWQATGELINYKTQASPSFATFGVPKNSECTKLIGVAGGVTVSNCEVSLENLATQFGHTTINGEPPTFLFKNCAITYSGGPILAREMTFYDSTFKFDVSGVPTQSGQLAMEQLTTADPTKPIVVQLGLGE